MYLKSDITLSDFDDLLLIIKTTAALSQPPPVHHLINFIAYLSFNSYSPSIVKTYMAAISVSLKYN
jgi:hypothetical protein